MNKAVIDTSGLRRRGKERGRPKGRQVDPQGAGGSARAARRRAAPARPPDRVPAPDPGCVRIHLRRARRRARAGDVARDDRGLRGRDVLSSLRRREGRRNAAAAADGARLRDAVVPDGGIGSAARGARRRLRARRARHRRAVHRALRARARRRSSAAIRSTARPPEAVHGGHRRQGRPSPPRPRTSTTTRTARRADTRTLPRVRARRAAARRRDQDDGGFEPARPGRRRVSRSAASGRSCAPSPRRG